MTATTSPTRVPATATHICPCQLPAPPRLRAIRNAARWGLAKAASQVDVDIMTMSRWERGLHTPRGGGLAKLLILIPRLEAEGRQHARNIGRPYEDLIQELEDKARRTAAQK